MSRGQRILLLFIMLGSLAYGMLAVSSVLQAWGRLPRTIATLAQQRTVASQQQLLYLRSPWYRGELLLTLITGVMFLSGAAGLSFRQRWSGKVLFGAAWVALAHVAWLLIASLEWFQRTGHGMLYQLNVLNIAWVLLILAIAPTARLSHE